MDQHQQVICCATSTLLFLNLPPLHRLPTPQNTSFPAFEFKTGTAQQQQQPANKAPMFVNPFAVTKQPAAAAVPDSLRMMDQRMASPEPATPASITSETCGAAAAAGGPPLTTLASLSKLSGASDNSGTVTPLTNMHASHVPLSSYYNSGSPQPAAAAAAAGKKASKLVWGDVLLWKQPLQTATIFISGLAAFGLLNFAAYGAHKMTLMSGGCPRGQGPRSGRVEGIPPQHREQAQPPPHDRGCPWPAHTACSRRSAQL